MLLVGLAESTNRVVQSLAALSGTSTRSCRTLAGALEAAQDRTVSVVVTAPSMPDATGDELAARFTDLPGSTILLTAVPPAYAPRVSALFDAIVVQCVGWVGSLAAALERHHRPNGHSKDLGPAAATLRELMLSGPEGFDGLAARIVDGTFSGPVEKIALTYLASAFDSEAVVPVLERVVVGDSKKSLPAGVEHGDIHTEAFERAVEIGSAGLQVIETVAASSAGEPALRARALRHLAAHFPHETVASTLAVVAREPNALLRYEAAHAALEAAQRADAFESVANLARGDVATDVRLAAIDWLAREGPHELVAPLLSSLVNDPTESVKKCAARAMVRRDEIQAETMEAAAQAGPRVEQRVVAMSSLVTSLPRAAALPALERLQVDDDPTIRRSAFQLAASIAGVGFEGTIERSAAEGPAMQRAVLLGISELGDRSFDALAHFLSSGVDVDLRAAALRLLAVRFRVRAASAIESQILGRDLCTAVIAAAAHLDGAASRVLGHAALRAPSADHRVAALRALVRLEDRAAGDAALARAARDEVESVRAASIELGIVRAGADAGSVLDRLSDHDVTAWGAALDGARALGAAGFGVAVGLAGDPRVPPSVRSAAREYLQTNFSTDAAPILASLPVPPIERPPPPPKKAPQKKAPAPTTTVEEKTHAPTSVPVAPDRAVTAPMAPARTPRAVSGTISTARAWSALQTALRSGASGARGLRALASSSRVPHDVRLQALRHLAADFSGAEVAATIESLMRGNDAVLQSAALVSATLRRDVPLDAFVHVAQNAADSDTRARAARFIGSRWPIREVRSVLESLLDDEAQPVRRAALGALFSSTRFVQEESLEEVLQNIFVEHQATEVRVSAAKALGVFGTERSKNVLQKRIGLFGDAAVESEARAALVRIRDRVVRTKR